jgi:hypothetical protein
MSDVTDFAAMVAAVALATSAVVGFLGWLLAPRIREAVKRIAAIETQVETNGHKTKPPTLRDNLDTIGHKMDDLAEATDKRQAEMVSTIVDLRTDLAQLCLWGARLTSVLGEHVPGAPWEQPPLPRRKGDPEDSDYRALRRPPPKLFDDD